MHAKLFLRSFFFLLISLASWPMLAYGQTFSMSLDNITLPTIVFGQLFSVSATTSGDVTAQTIQATINFSEDDRGKPGAYFITASVPNLGTFYRGEDGGWSPNIQNCSRGIHGNVDFLSASVGIVDNPTDLSALVGTQVYVGYGVCTPDQTTRQCYDNMNNTGTVSLAYTIPASAKQSASPTSSSAARQKRSTLIFKNPASPISFVTNSPSGTGIIGSRDASGKISELFVVKPDKTYYQLILGSTGLSGITVDGYQITVLSKDGNNNVSKISVKDPDGSVASYGDGGVFASATTDRICGGTGSDPNDENFPRTYACHLVDAIPAVDTLINVAEKIEGVWNWGVDKFNKLKDKFVNKKIAESGSEVKGEVDGLGTRLVNPTNDGTEGAITVSEDIPTVSSSVRAIAGDLLYDTKALGNNPKETNLYIVDSSKLKTLDGNWVNPVFCDAYQKAVGNVCVANCTSTQEEVNGICVAKCASNQTRQNGICVTTTLVGCQRPGYIPQPGRDGWCYADPKGPCGGGYTRQELPGYSGPVCITSPPTQATQCRANSKVQNGVCVDLPPLPPGATPTCNLGVVEGVCRSDNAPPMPTNYGPSGLHLQNGQCVYQANGITYGATNYGACDDAANLANVCGAGFTSSSGRCIEVCQQGYIHDSTGARCVVYIPPPTPTPTYTPPSQSNPDTCGPGYYVTPRGCFPF